MQPRGLLCLIYKKECIDLRYYGVPRIKCGAAGLERERRVQPAAAARCTPSDWLSWNCIPAAIGEETTTFEDGSSNSTRRAKKIIRQIYIIIHINLILLPSRCALCKLIGSAQGSFIFLSRGDGTSWVCVCVNLLVSAIAAAGAVWLYVIAFRMQTGSTLRERQMSITFWRAVPRVYYIVQLIINSCLSWCTLQNKFQISREWESTRLDITNGK